MFLIAEEVIQSSQIALFIEPKLGDPASFDFQRDGESVGFSVRTFHHFYASYPIYLFLVRGEVELFRIVADVACLP